MKKTIYYAVFFILVGAVFGRYFHDNIKALSVFNTKDRYYFIQEGVYSSKEMLDENTKDISNKVIINDNDKYYVYVGITKDLEIAQIVKNIYDKLGYQTYIKEVNLNNNEFANNLEQFDLLVKNSDSDEDVLTVEEVILSNYEEIVLNNK